MYVGVIRGDLPGPLFLADVEPSSQINFPVDPKGQTVYLAYPNPTVLTNFMAGLSPDGQHAEPGSGVSAGIQGSSAVTFPLTLTGSNNVLSIQYVSAGPFTAYTIPAATYATMTTLLAAVNKVLSAAGAKATATTDATGTLFVLQSTAVGVGAFIEVNVVGTSTFNTPAHFADHQTFTVPTAAATITALLPISGPLNVSAAHVLSTLGASPSALKVVAVIAPHFVESEVAIQSYQVGNMSRLLEANFTPDGNRLPALAKSAAITVVEDDGVTVFSSSASAGLPTITGAAHNSPNTGDITITGTGLGNSEFFNATAVTVTSASGSTSVHLNQKLIAHTVSGGTTGSVSATSIVIPASLLAGLGVAGSKVKLKYVSLPNCTHGVAASITTAILGVSTLTGVTGMTAASVGSFIKITGAANPTNNGQFLVLSFISATSVTVGIYKGVGADANNGSLVWVNSPVSFTVT